MEGQELVQRRLEAVIARVHALHGRQVAITPLSGGITNHNYRVDVDGASYVLRLGGEGTDLLGIERDREYACSRAAAEAGVGAEVVAYLPEHAALVTRFVQGRVLEPGDTRQPQVLRRAVTALRRFHAAPPVPGTFSPFATVREYHALARAHGVDLPATLNGLDRIEQELASSQEPPCPCHNDLLASNFIDDGTTMRIIDWEYAGMGDRFFDLGNLAVNHALGPDEERALLALYFGGVEPAQLRRLRLMRLASDMREALWGFAQAGISTLDFDFMDYARTHLERFRAAAAALDDPIVSTGTGGPIS